MFGLRNKKNNSPVRTHIWRHVTLKLDMFNGFGMLINMIPEVLLVSIPCLNCSRYVNIAMKICEYDQEIQQSHTAGHPTTT